MASTRFVEVRNELYALAVFARGLIDYYRLHAIVHQANWTSDTKTLEEVWDKLWDCRQRTTRFAGGVTGPINDAIENLLSQLDEFYEKNFGPGVYASTDILVKKSTCSICEENIKLCAHIPGHLYEGQMCLQKMDDFELLSVSMVTNPADPRCRMWPWNYDEEKSICRGTFFTAFQIDDFLCDAEWAQKLRSEGRKYLVGNID